MRLDHLLSKEHMRSSDLQLLSQWNWLFTVSDAVAGPRGRWLAERTVGTLFSREGVGVEPDLSRHLENCIASTIVLDSYDPSYKGSTVDALALRADEGRGRLR